MGTTRSRRCSNQEEVTASHGSSHCQQPQSPIQQAFKPNQTKPFAFLPNLVSGGSQLNFAAGKPTPKHSAPLEFVCNRTRDGDSPSTMAIPFFWQAGRQAVKGCIAAFWLISILCCLFTVNLAAKNGRGMASQMLKRS